MDVEREHLWAAVRQDLSIAARKVCRQLGTTDGEDLVQRAIAKTLTQVRDGKVAEWKDDLFAYAYSCLLNAARDVARARSRRPEVSLTAIKAEPPGQGQGPAAESARREEEVAFQKALRQLSEKERAVVELRLTGLSYQDIAAALRISTGSIGPTMERTRLKLRALLP